MSDPHRLGLADAAQMKIELDQDKASALGVSLAEINSTMQTAFGSTYANNFVNGPRVQRVIVQLDAPFRMTPEDLGKVYLRNKTGGMVPIPIAVIMVVPLGILARSRPSRSGTCRTTSISKPAF